MDLHAGRRALAGVLLAMVLVGCEDQADKMSKYPYFLKTLQDRWPVARGSLASDKPNISFVGVLLKDMDGAVAAMDWNYNRPNRDEAIAKLKKVAADFRKDLEDKVDMTGPSIVLKPGATPKDVADATERAYTKYLEFQKMVAE
jgi:hypothetical protein